jgi:hypothetical protein
MSRLGQMSDKVIMDTAAKTVIPNAATLNYMPVSSATNMNQPPRRPFPRG